MKSKLLLLFSFLINLLLIILLVYFEAVNIFISFILLLLSLTTHGLLYYRMNLILNDIEQVNRTLEKLVAGVHGTRIYTGNEKTRVLNANVNRLAKQMEKMAVKKIEDEQMIKLLTDYITSPIIYVDIDGRVRYVNDQFNKKFKANIKTNDWYELIPVKEVYQFIDEAFIKELSYNDTIAFEDQFYYVNAVTIKDLRNRFVGILFIFNDVTEIKRFEKLQRDFLADASHELKTPISVIKGASEILLDRSHEPETVMEFLQMIQTENERMEKIVQDILLISKLESDINLSFETVNVNQLIKETVEHVQIHLDVKEQPLQLDIEHNLTLYGDYERIKHALSNLLVNASGYTERGKKIFIKAWETKTNVCIQVKDQGMGISKTDLPHIFKRFYRVNKDRSRETGGTGLGLSIVKSVVDVHEGEITVDSSIGKGTTFTLCFPKRKKKN